MGWGSGVVEGREVGYLVDAVCDYPGCSEPIDRGLGYVCGPMHGHCEWGCGFYFCGTHLGDHKCPKPAPSLPDADAAVWDKFLEFIGDVPVHGAEAEAKLIELGLDPDEALERVMAVVRRRLPKSGE